jgi:N-methylhydantoinase A
MTGKQLSVGVDIGGTFTDCAIVSSSGRIVSGKCPTTPEDRSILFFDAIEDAARKLGLYCLSCSVAASNWSMGRPLVPMPL